MEGAYRAHFKSKAYRERQILRDYDLIRLENNPTLKPRVGRKKATLRHHKPNHEWASTGDHTGSKEPPASHRCKPRHAKPPSRWSVCNGSLAGKQHARRSWTESRRILMTGWDPRSATSHIHAHSRVGYFPCPTDPISYRRALNYNTAVTLENAIQLSTETFLMLLEDPQATLQKLIMKLYTSTAIITLE